MARLEGKRALITGAARGIGAAIARRFADEGAKVVINDLDAGAATKAASELGGLGIAADVSDVAAVQAMFDTVEKELGGLDVLVNNAGIGGFEHDVEKLNEQVQRGMVAQGELMGGGPVKTHLDATLETTDAEWSKVLAVHLNGTFHCTRAALKLMAPGGPGSIINMGSIMGTAGGAGAIAYSAAKAGILGLTRAVARDVVSRDIRVNAIAPGFIATDMTSHFEMIRPMIEMQTPMHRFGDVDDIAWAAVYLASDEAKFVTGQVLSPNGGWHMSQ